MKIKTFFVYLFLIISLCGVQTAFSADSVAEKELQDLKNRLRQLEKQISAESAAGKELQDIEKRLQQLEKRFSEESIAEKQEKWPDWTQNIKVSGDLRLRYEGIYNREQRQSDGSTKDLPTRDRYRIRARLFVDGKINDEISTHFMVCTNQDSNREATTTNQSLTDDFNDKGIYFHRAYATYKPKWLEGAELTAGKFKNTFLHTDIMWDPDVNPEGIYERYQYKGLKTFQPFVHLGQMVVNEVKDETDDACLYVNQLGFDWEIGPVKWTLAGSYYDWSNLHNTKFLHNADYKKGGGNTFIKDQPFDPEDPSYQYAYDYNLWGAITFINFKWGAVPTKLIFDYIVNTADDVPSSQDTAYFAGFTLGKEKKKGDWSLLYKYARIEKDAVIGSMNDQDFYGANRKGHKVMFRYMVYDRLRFGTAYFYTDPIKDWDPASITFSNEKDREHEDRLQAEFVFTF